jgi:hypothetical protein
MWKDYLKESVNNAGSLDPNNLFLFNKIPIVFLKPYETDIDLRLVTKRINKIVPSWCFLDIEEIFIGDFDFLKERKVKAIFQDGCIYLLNSREEEKQIFSDIIHEVAHSIESYFGEEINFDGLSEEFFGKRYRAGELLKARGIHIPSEYLNSPDYFEEFDEMLQSEIGYENLQGITRDLFPNPYSITSLSEYFAVGFEKYFEVDLKEPRFGFQERANLKELCPVLFGVVDELIEEKNA